MINHNAKFDFTLSTDEQAIEFIAKWLPGTQIVQHSGETCAKKVISCGRCGGSGIYTHYHGVCFVCGGHNSTQTKYVPIKKFAQQAKSAHNQQITRDEKREAKRLARLDKQRDINEAQGRGRLTFGEYKQARLDANKKKWAAEKEAAAPVPEGRMEVTGEVIKVGILESQFGNRLVMTVKADEGYVLWGSVPSDIAEPEKGQRITFTGTLSQSDKDEKFGFFKRPTKASILDSEIDPEQLELGV